MGIKLYFSNTMNVLSDIMADNISDAYKIDENIFNNPVIIVPNINFAKWVKISLARKLSICMNLDFQYLENGLLMLFKTSDFGYRSIKFLNNDILELLIFFTLKNIDITEPQILPFKNYLMSENGSKGLDFEIKAWQLSTKLAVLFREYESSRFEMIREWKNGIILSNAIAISQRWMYLKILEVKEEFSKKKNTNLFSLYDYFSEVFVNKNAKVTTLKHKKQIFFFGFSQIQELHLKLIDYLKINFEISIYSISPSKRQWEQKKNLNNFTDSKNDIFTEINSDNKLLALWGKPAIENINLLCQLTNYAFQSKFLEKNKSESILEKIQYNILTLSEVGNEKRNLGQDYSLQILSCPSIRREVETIYNSIIQNLSKNKKLLLTDISVLVTDINLYRPIIESVFNQSPSVIRYNIIGSDCGAKSAFSEAIVSIIDLSIGTFNRKDVFNLLHNPCVMKYWDYGVKEIEIWMSWTRELGIFCNFKNENKDFFDKKFPLSGIHTWRNGLERMRLSRVMFINEFEIGKDRHNFKGLVPFEDLNTQDAKLVSKFSAIVEALHNIVSSMKINKANITTWRRLIFNFINNFLCILDYSKLEKKVFESFIKYFDTLAIYNDFGTINSDHTLDLITIKSILTSHFSDTLENHSNDLSGGVTVSPLLLIKSIPFKITYLMGMGEGNFPGKTEESFLDVRKGKHQIGDVNISESNKDLFLKILISTKKKLYISYISKNLKKDQDLHLCSGVKQLQRYIEQHIFKKNIKFNIVKIPIKGSNRAYFTHSLCSWTDVMINYSQSDFVSFYTSNNQYDFIKKHFNQDLNMDTNMNPNLSFDKVNNIQHNTKPTIINIKTMKSFLIDPVSEKIKYCAGNIEEFTKYALSLEHDNEPFATDYEGKYYLKKTSVENWLLAIIFGKRNCYDFDFVVQEFNMIYDDYMRKSITPQGYFALHERNLMKEEIIALAENLLKIVDIIKNSIEYYSDFILGSPEYNSVIDSDFSKIFCCESTQLNIEALCKHKAIDSIPILLQGSIKWIWKDNDTKWNVLIPVCSKKYTKYSENHTIEALLCIMAAISNNKINLWSESVEITFHIVFQNSIDCFTYFLNKNDTRKYLIELLEDFFDFSRFIWLPINDIISNTTKRKLVTQDEVKTSDEIYFFEDMTRSFNQNLNTASGLSKAILPYNILNIARKRFGILLSSTKT